MALISSRLNPKGSPQDPQQPHGFGQECPSLPEPETVYSAPLASPLEEASGAGHTWEFPRVTGLNASGGTETFPRGGAGAQGVGGWGLYSPPASLGQHARNTAIAYGFPPGMEARLEGRPVARMGG